MNQNEQNSGIEIWTCPDNVVCSKCRNINKKEICKRCCIRMGDDKKLKNLYTH